MKRLRAISRFSVLIYWAILIALLGMFFTNDYGLVDIRKTSIITAIGIEYEEGDVVVTAQLAVPQPSQSGEAITYTAVQGRGLTVADALNEINSKTGFYPKLLFCKLIVLGKTCQAGNIFEILDCFYRNTFSELTPLVAMFDGKSCDLMCNHTPITDLNALSVQRVLSEELKKSANVSTVNLKDIAMTQYSPSGMCYMPLVEAHKPGTSEGGGGGDSVGGDPPQQGSESSGGSGGSGGSEGGGGSSESTLQEADYSARKTVMFKNGLFVGILDDKQSFALDIIKNEVHIAVVPCEYDGLNYTLRLKDASGGVGLSVENGVPKLMVSFKAKAQINGVTEASEPQKNSRQASVPPEVLNACKEELQSRLQSLVEKFTECDCDVLGAKELLFKYNNKYYDAFKDDLLTRMQVEYKIDVGNIN